MAQENGTIASAAKMTVIRDIFPNDPPLTYVNPLGLTLTDGMPVTMDVDFSGPSPEAKILTAGAITPPGTTLIDTNKTADIFISTGEILKVTNGATLTGNVVLTGGTLTVDKNSTITGNVIAIAGATINLDSANINGDIDMFDGVAFNIIGGGNTGDLIIKRNKSVIIGGGNTGDLIVKKSLLTNVNGIITTGDIKIRGSKSPSVTNCTIGGDLIMKNNTLPCTDTGNVVTGRHVKC